uniref:Uncharacterized protein n=1 Tax=Arundo donax TaxID=35708 RepID=A0A0A9EXI7_ARUDO
MVSSDEVSAFWQAPNSAPMLSRNLTMSWLVYRDVALKARCSTMCATPRSSSSSITDPTLTASESAARMRGLGLERT